MSHRATNWAIEQRGLRPATKVVLFHLADRHNPDFGCFPSQKRLADDCEMSRASINQHLGILEAKGLLKRIQRRSEKTHRQQTTRYLFPFEEGFDEVPGPSSCPASDGQPATAPEPRDDLGPAREPCLETGHGSVSRNEGEPCPETAKSRVQNLDTNLVREPLREPCVGGASAAHIQIALDGFWEAFPRHRNKQCCRELLADALARGIDPAWIIRSAERYRAENLGNKAMYLAFADNWLDARRWEDFPNDAPTATAGPISSTEAAARFWTDKVKSGRYVPPNAISSDVAAFIIGKGFLIERDLLRAGVRL